jgi:hypothetical protein
MSAIPEMITVPDGKGGWTKVPAGTQVKQDTSKQAKIMEEAIEKDFYEAAGKLALYINKLVRIYAKENGLTHQEAAAGVYLENCNNRFFFPAEDGGVEEFDRVTALMWEWFKKQPKD